MAAPAAPGPEQKLTSIVTLASAVDGVDLVVSAHEGLVYSVESPNPSMQPYAEELASLSATYVEVMRTTRATGKASVVLASHRDRSLLVADLGEGYTVAVLGSPQALSVLLDPVKRIIENRPLRCPSCGAVVEVFTDQCPSCGKRLPFGADHCPYCGAGLTAKRCPNCGASLLLVAGRLEAAAKEEAKPAPAAPAAAAPAEAKPSAAPAGERLIPAWLGAVITTVGAVVYGVLAYALGISAGDAAIAGAVPIAVGYILSFFRLPRR